MWISGVEFLKLQRQIPECEMLFKQYKKVEQHPEGRLYAIGDVHGCLELLKVLLNKMDFDEERDQIVFVGDYADRGSQSIETLQFVLDKPWFHLIAGNHEELLLASSRNLFDDEYQEMVACWKKEEGGWTDDIAPEVLNEVCNKLTLQCHYIVEAHTTTGHAFGITHAGYHETQWYKPGVVYEDNYYRRLMWSRMLAESTPETRQNISGIDYTVHGHTIFKTPLIKGKSIFIDTGGYYFGRLSALDLNNFAKTQSLENSTTSVP